MNLETIIKQNIAKGINTIYNQNIQINEIQIQPTRKDFEGDVTVVVFPLLKYSKKSPEQTAIELGNYLKENIHEIINYQVIKGFLNLTISNSFWINTLNHAHSLNEFGKTEITSESKKIVIEYSSPNTNKPLHLGHIRNNLIGNSLARILKACGNNVFQVNLVNDRGIHICKSMLAYQKWGFGETPESSGLKGDKLVGKYYVIFDKEYKLQIDELKNKGEKEDDAKKNAPLMQQAQEMLRMWEAHDTEIRNLWSKMNFWVYQGFDVTYRNLGIEFDKIYYESDTYLLGKKMVSEGLEKKILYRKADNTVCIDLTNDGLDEKVLLRSDGTSVYITQDMGTANLRYEDYQFDKQIYVVGNEQDYHFKVLFKVLEKLGNDWAKNLYHLSYGMVELPEGKMKSREGTVVDADDLIEEMISTAREMSEELGKLEGFSNDEKETIFSIIGLGALKYYMLKVDPKKNMLFNPKESIDFNGNTGPFVQYTYTRILSVLRKAEENQIGIPSIIDTDIDIDKKETQLIKLINQYPEIVKESGNLHSPALIANYAYELAKEYNQFYHDFQIIKEENNKLRYFRLMLSATAAKVIKSALDLLGIEVPERM